MEVLWTVVVLLTILQVTASQQASLRYEGCYVDQEDRNFPDHEKWDGQNTNIRCVSHCREKGYPYAATEFTWQCFCGSEEDFDNLPVAVSDSDCFTNCAGDQTEKCGGTWRMSVYAVLALSNEIRLVGGQKDEEGRVEVRAVGTNDWGTVCSDDFDMDDAAVACRMLGWGDPEHVRDSTYFGQGSGEVKMADLNCNGHESSLFDCSYDGPGSHSCDHSDDVGLVCEGVLSAGAIVGIVFGVLAAIVIVITIICVCCQKNKTPGRVLGNAPPAGGAPAGVVQTSNVMLYNGAYVQQQGMTYNMQPLQAPGAYPQPAAAYPQPAAAYPQPPAAYPQPMANPAAPQFPPPPTYDQAAKPSTDQLYPQ